MSHFGSVKLTGIGLARAHSSVNSEYSLKKTYETINIAKNSNPAHTDDLSKAIRLHAIYMAIERAQKLGQRFRENHHVSVSDHMRMEQEFKYLKESTAKIINSAKNHDTIEFVDNKTLLQRHPQSNEADQNLLVQVMNDAFQGKATIQNSEDLKKNIESLSNGTLLHELANNLSINILRDRDRSDPTHHQIFSVMNLRENIAYMRTELHNLNYDHFLERSKNLINISVLENATSSLKTQTKRAPNKRHRSHPLVRVDPKYQFPP